MICWLNFLLVLSHFLSLQVCSVHFHDCAGHSVLLSVFILHPISSCSFFDLWKTVRFIYLNNFMVLQLAEPGNMAAVLALHASTQLNMFIRFLSSGAGILWPFFLFIISTFIIKSHMEMAFIGTLLGEAGYLRYHWKTLGHFEFWWWLSSAILIYMCYGFSRYI